MMPTPSISIKFDFRHYVPNQDLNAGTIQLDNLVCDGKSFIITLLAENLTPGHSYRTTYELLSPATTDNVFNPAIGTLYASFNSQSFVTAATLPKGTKEVNEYILKATIVDASEGSTDVGSTQIKLICGIQRPVFNLSILDGATSAAPINNTIDVGNCDSSATLVGIIGNASVGQKYTYEFFDSPVGSVIFENQNGAIFPGDNNQNFNTKVALTGYPYAFINTKVTEIDTGIVRTSKPILLKCYQTNSCDVVLPTGVNYSIDAPTFKKCFQRGLTQASISSLYGGAGFAIGDKLTTTGGGGYGAEIQILSGGLTVNSFNNLYGGSGFNIGDLIQANGGGGTGGLLKITSGGLTNSSIDSITGCTGFKVGDLLTTVGGGGKDSVISVVSTGVNGSISSYDVINPGYGYTAAPTGVVSLSSVGACASATFNANNFTIPAMGSITNDSLNLYGGSGYNIGEILNVGGGGGSDAQIQITTGSLTNASITSLSGGSGYIIGDYLSTSGGGGSDVVIRVTATGVGGSLSGFNVLNGGYGFSSEPLSVVTLSGSGNGASLVANANNFSITPKGGLTKASISGLISSGSGYSVGSLLIAIGGGGSGGLLEVISVNSGVISGYIVKNPGQGYVGVPQLINENQQPISNQPSWNTSNFTKPGYVVIDGGYGYLNNPTLLLSTNGDGSGAEFVFDSQKFTNASFVVVNSGSGYTSAPTSFTVQSGDGSGMIGSANANNFTIPCSGGITYSSISGLIGKSTFTNGEELVVEGGGGSGARLKVTGVNSGAITSFVVLNAGCAYTSSPTVKKLNGSIINGISFDINLFSSSAFTVTNPGYGFYDAPSGLSVLSGNGDTESVFVVFNTSNFIDIIGPEPTPSSTPTPTVTPTPSPAVECNSLQTAGGANTTSSVGVAVSANSGQNYIVLKDTSNLQIYTILEADGIVPGTYITKIENFFANFDNRTIYKKVSLSNNLASPLGVDASIKVYIPDVRLIKVPYWPGDMTFLFDAYGVPDRFKVYAVPMTSTAADILLYDSGYRGSVLGGYVTALNGPGSGSAQISKPDGCVYIRVVVEAPLNGTAWEYNLSCPVRTYTTITPTPTPTVTKTSTPTTTPTPSPTRP